MAASPCRNERFIESFIQIICSPIADLFRNKASVWMYYWIANSNVSIKNRFIQEEITALLQ